MATVSWSEMKDITGLGLGKYRDKAWAIRVLKSSMI
jgi:hypothetical protein